MSWGHEEADDAKERVSREIQRRQARGEEFVVLDAPKGSAKLTKTFWGKAWCSHLEEHSHYEHRLPRGRSYLRNGKVYNLCIEPGKVTSVVAGSDLYEVQITIKPLEAEVWTNVKAQCAGQVSSLLDLLAGRLGDGVMKTITHPEDGLFPQSREIRFSCTCPDYADLCKHAAATLYGVGLKLETQPDLLFVLRSVNPGELLQGAAQSAMRGDGSDAALAGEDLSSLFGIDLGETD
jgi:uncharacterized Zn finger protein